MRRRSESIVRASLAALAFVTAGCSSNPPPSVPAPAAESPYTLIKPDRPATTVDKVTLYPWYELPDGLFVIQG